MRPEFSSLPTEQFRLKMRPFALEIYQRIFPGCWLEDLREQGVRVHILDKEFGIDALLHLPSSTQWVSVQEKYRDFKHLQRWGDFTQEYKNAAGTPYESDGEWLKLGAQLYFYGWANELQTGFAKWVLLDVAKYKCSVERQGGLARIGTLKQNRVHGSASFYGIPLSKLGKAILLTNESLDAIPAFRKQKTA